MPLLAARSAIAAALVLAAVLTPTAVAAPEPVGSAGRQTAAAAAADGRGRVVVVAAGDISDCAPPRCPAARTARRVEAIDPTRVLTVGDNQYERGAVREFVAAYGRTWGRFPRRTRPVPGNHEYLTAGARGYFRYFGRRAHRRSNGYYSFDVGAWHVVALNSSNGCRTVRCGASSRQVNWLRRDLDRHAGRCVLAYWHHPPWSSGAHGGTPAVQPMWRVLARNGGDVVVNGHDHDYERFAPRGADGSAAARGMRQFVVGTGGAELRSFSSPHGRLSRKRIAHRNGVLRLALGRRSFGFRFVTAAGRVLDRGGPIGCG